MATATANIGRGPHRVTLARELRAARHTWSRALALLEVGGATLRFRHGWLNQALPRHTKARHMEFEDVKAFYERELAWHRGEPVGATMAQIRKVERHLGVTLPETYVAFLLWMGADSRGIFGGTNMFVWDLVDSTDYLPEFLKDNDFDWKPNGTALVPFCHQAYILAWFDLPEADPKLPFWFFSEGGKTTTPTRMPNFWQFLVDDMRHLEACARSL